MTIEVDEIIEQVAPLSSWCIVLRPFGGDSGVYLLGEVVDTTNWLHKNSLIQRRYIKPLPYGIEVPELTRHEDGTERRMITSLTARVETTERPTPSRKKQ